MLPRSSFLFFLRCSAAPFPAFACPPPSFCSFCSSSYPSSNPSLLLAFCTSASSWLALLLLVGNLLMFRHVSERVVLPASRKFAEGRGVRRFLEQGILDNPHILYIYIHSYIHTKLIENISTKALQNTPVHSGPGMGSADSNLSLEDLHCGSKKQGPTIVGVPPPFFPGILLSRDSPET